jgi:C4-type Zn-finger protein
MQKRIQTQKRKQNTQKNRKYRQTKRQRGGDITNAMNGTAIDLETVIITDKYGNSRSYADYMKHAEDMDRQGSR